MRSGSATNGAPNTGGGGGAGLYDADAGRLISPAGTGGSGLVQIVYTGTTPQATGGTITSGSVNGVQIVTHTFTASGDFITN